MKSQGYVLFCAIGGVALGASCAAMAQQTAGNGVEEVVVTAQRRSEALENVPMTVDVVTPQQLQQSGITNFMQLGEVATGAQMGFSGSVPGVSIRGVTSIVAGYNLDPNVAVYIDGIYDPQLLTLASDIANLQSIQILEGPQGTLYGRNATGGAILITTLGPSDTFQGKMDASYGTYNDTIENVYVAGPINDRVRWSITGHYQHGDDTERKASDTVAGATTGPAAKFEEANGRAKVQVDLNDKLQATAGMSVNYHNDPRADFYDPVDHILPPPFYPPPPLSSGTFGVAQYGGKAPYDFAYQYEPTLTLAWETPIGKLTSYTGYDYRYLGLAVDFDSTTLNIIQSPIRYKQSTWQESVDYQITAIKNFDLDVGGMYYSDYFRSPHSFPDITFTGAPSLYIGGALASVAHTYQNSKSWALYIDGTYHVTDKLSLNAGGRFSSDYRQDEYDTEGPGGIGPDEILQPPTTNSHTWTKFTPRATVRYELAPRTDAYVSFTEGYKEGAFNPAGSICGASVGGALPTCILPPAQPETIYAYEGGFKAAWDDVRVQTSVFHYDYHNLQLVVVAPNPVNPLADTSFLESAPISHITGWDSEIDATPIEHLTLHGGFELLHARFGSFPDASGTGVDPTNSVNVTNETQNWTGLDMPRAPNWSGNASFNYEYPFAYGTINFNMSLNFTGSFIIDNPSTDGPLAPAGLQNYQRLRQNSYALLNGQLGWTDSSKHITVTLYGTNITNTSYRLTYDAGAFGDFSVKADPVMGGVRVGYKF
jgi:iron complex outermembrane receptor protein